MTLNITFEGFVYDKNTVLCDNNTYYQGLFYPNNTASSAMTWSDVRVVENTGYWNCNLGNLLWLGQEGIVLSNSIVIIVFWKGSNDRTNDCSVLTEWAAFEQLIDGSSTYNNTAQTMDNVLPDLHWFNDIPLHGLVDTTYTITNTSEDEHSWDFNGITMNHWNSRYGQVINGPNVIDNTDYYWGDTQSTLDLSGAANSTHQWSNAGTYETTIVIEDDCGATVTGTESFDIYWHEPAPNIVMTPSDPLPNEPVSFSYIGTDVDNRITSIEWIVSDSGDYGNTNTTTTSGRDDNVIHSSGLGTDWYGQSATTGAFTNPGTHNVAIVIHWNDGFSDQTINYNEDFTQSLFSGPTTNFTQYPLQATVGSGITFTNTSTDVGRVGLGLPDNIEYEWTWYDGIVVETTDDQNYIYQLAKIPTSAVCEVKLCADWSDGWDTIVTCITKDVVFATSVAIEAEDCYYSMSIVGTSSDGSVSGYGWTVSSGTYSTGPWELVWESPIDINQQTKFLCFTTTGWYKMEGSVYGAGTTTSDNDVMFITEVCPETLVPTPICAPDMKTYVVGNSHMKATYDTTNL